ncbi:MAG: AbrB/MazE/SpoVT family DNA-binding domain-containing protein [Calditrichaeota bacterium]|nr:MAG: AbrB/MazE/SpoVT family DNA-binding domain-containing protein [Calditrichota bacterium]MBL1205688.1 AbrB/MazE/SpoVT family DNA-binding domain-containing protein [Calditrichota bacterium]NOG45516.1 AbrB/MazE/SpoVT family DNA-binding domain-containing protein [Calditrichota bacterium]
MSQTIFESGNSLAVRIPKGIADALKMGKGTQVEFKLEQDSLVVTPNRIPKYNLSDLLAGFPDNERGQEVDWGSDVGKEIVE